MTTKNPKRIVIDTSVARAYGMGLDEPSISARRCLQEVMKICHRVVLTEALLDEYRRNLQKWGHFAEWLAAMTAKDKAPELEVPEDDELREAIASWAAPIERRRAAEKDACLIEAAGAGDRIILSLDDRARKAFVEIASATRYPGLRDLVWVNPREGDEVIIWLRQGAPREPDWTLDKGDP